MEDAPHCLRTKSDGTARSFADPKQKELNETKRVYSAGPSAGPTLVLKGKSSVRKLSGCPRVGVTYTIWFSDLLQERMEELLLGNCFNTGSGLACVCWGGGVPSDAVPSVPLHPHL